MRNRIVVITDSADPRASAFVGADLQQIYPNKKVITARAALVDVRPALRQLLSANVDASVRLSNLKEVLERVVLKSKDEQVLSSTMSSLFGDLRLRTNNPVAFVLQLVSQLAALNWNDLTEFSSESPLGAMLQSLMPHSAGESDSQLGVCVLPIFSMSADDVDDIKASSSGDALKGILSKYGILEYFFPRIPSFTLGLVDRGFATQTTLGEGIALAPERGHPFADNEAAPSVERALGDLVDTGLATEDHDRITLTDAGIAARQIDRLQPKESLLIKVQNLSVEGNLNSFFCG